MPQTILFILPVAFVQKPDEPGFQVQTQNFRTTFGFVLPRLKQRNTNVELVSLNNTGNQLVNGKAYVRETGLNELCNIRFLERKMGRGKLFPQFAQFFLNLRYLIKLFRKSKPSVVYGYNDVGTLYGVFLKWLFGCRLIYDMRGDRVNEMAVQGAPAWRVWFYRRVRNVCLKTADLVFTVSDTCPDLPKGTRHLPKYNFFDARKFFYDSEMEDEVREELGIGERFVFVYSGTDKYYQMVPEMVRFFADFRKFCPDAWFMINTPVPSQKFADELEKNNVPPSAYGMFQLNQEMLNRYQMIGDMAFLIREDLPLNHDAFPTKFSEYLGSGVPVLITAHVHTLLSMVKDNGLGEIWHPGESVESVQERIVKYRNNKELKKRCAAFAFEYLSWQKKADWLVDNLHNPDL
ncbi:MAG: glycosyltransferase [Prolixibacteraceae bacterium]